MNIKQLDNKKIPKHIAVIMDGNGRWARKRGLKREFGHREGKKAVKGEKFGSISGAAQYAAIATESDEENVCPVCF